MSKYEYLKRFLPPHSEHKGMSRNLFLPVTQEEISEAQKKIRFPFPESLLEFWTEIGYGFLKVKNDAPDETIFSGSNRIYPPSDIADILLIGHESEMISQEVLDILEPDDMPFFEIGDSCRFLIMKPLSDTPNTVWTTSGIKIEDSFEKFIWRLYYESPWFYDDLIEAHYAKLK